MTPLGDGQRIVREMTAYWKEEVKLELSNNSSGGLIMNVVNHYKSEAPSLLEVIAIVIAILMLLLKIYQALKKKRSRLKMGARRSWYISVEILSPKLIFDCQYVHKIVINT